VIVGSKLLGQNFSSKKYFWGRPSATTPAYNAAASSGSNLGPTNKSYLSTVQERSSQIRNTLQDKAAAIPVDLVTASGSGLDPDISPAAAALQIDRVALERGLTRAQLQTLLAAYTKPRQMGIFGEPRVNVVELNLALDNMMP
jgi:K+-transporting ATPase ATPase C chain